MHILSKKRLKFNALLFSAFILPTKLTFAASASFELIPSAGDSSSATPFAVKVKAQELNPADTSYKFSVWVYDRPASRYISRIWTPEGWKSGWTYYQPFYPNTGSERVQWAYLRIYKGVSPDTNNYYIKFKFRDGDTAETYPVEYPNFRILNMQEMGWLAGTIYKDAGFTTPYQNINVIAKEAGATVGAYVSEDNKIDEGNPNMAGRFYLAVPIGEIDEIKFQDYLGNQVNGYLGSPPPYQITAKETTWVDPFYIQDVSFIPDYPEIGDSLIIRVIICNPGNEIHNCVVSARSNDDEIGAVNLSIPAHSSAAAEIVWRDLPKGKYKLEITAKTQEWTSIFSQYLQIGAGDVLINEVMFNPSSSGEWIEIINNSTDSISLKNWTIEDPQTKNTITNEDKYLSPGGFAIIAESTAQTIKAIYGDLDAEIFSLYSLLPTLNNDADTIIIKDAENITQDILRYDGKWASNKARGVSLERISPNIATNDSKNWGSCVIAVGATPGKTNSIYASYIPKTARLSVEPKIFYPRAGVAFISYTLPFSKALVRLYIYDRCGRLVRKLVDGHPSGAESRYFWEKGEVTWGQIWDGKDDNDEILPIGLYIVYLEAKDEESATLISKKTTVVIAK